MCDIYFGTVDNITCITSPYEVQIMPKVGYILDDFMSDLHSPVIVGPWPISRPVATNYLSK